MLAFIAAVVLAISPVSQERPFHSSGEIKTRLRERGIVPEHHEAIRGTAFILDSTGKAYAKLPEGQLFSRRPLSASETHLSPAEVKELVSLLHGNRTYMPDCYNACIPSYELGVTLVSSKGYTEVLFCLSCDAILVLDGTGFYPINAGRSHNAILRFFQQAFPRDATLAKLKPQKKEVELDPNWVIGWARENIPEDPLLKRVMGMKPEERTFEVLEELTNKATFRARGGRDPAPPRTEGN